MGVNMNEPVAWIWSEDGCNLGVCLDQDKQIGKQEFQDYSIPLYTHPVKEQDIEKLIGDLRNVAKAQGQKGCWDFDQYMLGLFNGLELALSIFEKREPQYRELPPHPVKELTDEEINVVAILQDAEIVPVGHEIWKTGEEFNKYKRIVLATAKALRKAQEK